MTGLKSVPIIKRNFRIEDPIQAAVDALETLPESSDDALRHQDGLLIACCWRLVSLQRLRRCLFDHEGEPRDQPDEHAAFIALIEAAEAPLASYTCDCRAETTDGHRARAATFLAFDQSGLLLRASLRDIFGEPLLASLVLDILVWDSR